MSDVSVEVITAAYLAAGEPIAPAVMKRILDAVAPLIAAAERERIAALAEADADKFADDWIDDAAGYLRDFAAKVRAQP